MPDVSPFLPKRKKGQRQRLAPPSHSAAALSPSASSSHDAAGPSSSKPSPSAKPQGNTTEFKLFSSGLTDGLRYNIMKLNSGRDVDPTQITRPILMNRKQPGPRAPPVFAFDDEGKIIGRYVYDEAGKPVLGADGKPTIEKKNEMDMSLVGTAPGEGGRRKVKKGVKEVFHQDIDVIRLRREENTPWILESGQPKEKTNLPEHWVGRMQEPSAMPTVLLVNDGRTEGFKVVTLGRTYRFEPERPFKVLDPDAAHKLFEHQAKYKIHDRWAQREGGRDIINGPGEPRMKVEGQVQVKQEDRAMRMEQRMRAARAPALPRVKIERFDDDLRREGRQLERGLEGGADEELDYDVNDDFQDDEENNTFYRNEDEEEEAKLQEERLKKEFRLANANVGDKPQIEEDEDEGEDDLFGEKLNTEGKKLRKMMRKRLNGQADDLFGESDLDESSSEAETVKTDKDKDKDKEKDKERERSAPPSAERPSRPPSRGPHGRGTSSPTGRRTNPPPISGKASTAPPGSGSALLAQRAASRGVSPQRSRQSSPLNGRATSPETGRAASPTGSARGISPAAPVRGSSPASAREASPAPSTSTARPKQGKRKPTDSPFENDPSASASASQKRKPSPVADRDRKKKKSASTTPTPAEPDVAPFPGMITQTDVLDWFKRQGGESVPMNKAIQEFKERIVNAGARKDDNQKLFLHWVGALTVNEPGKRLRLKDGL